MDKIIFLDTETGGLDPSFSLLTLYARIVDKDLNFIDDINLKIMPDNGVFNCSDESLRINKINLDQHKKEAITESEAKIKLKDFISKHSNDGKDRLTLAGQNVDFDTGFISSHLISEKEWNKFVSFRKIDTMVLVNTLKFAGILPKELKGSLSSIASHFGIDADGAHDAKKDIEITIQVFANLLKMISSDSEKNKSDLSVFCKNIDQALDEINSIIQSTRKRDELDVEMVNIKKKLQEISLLGSEILNEIRKN